MQAGEVDKPRSASDCFSILSIADRLVMPSHSDSAQTSRFRSTRVCTAIAILKQLGGIAR